MKIIFSRKATTRKFKWHTTKRIYLMKVMEELRNKKKHKTHRKAIANKADIYPFDKQ